MLTENQYCHSHYNNDEKTDGVESPINKLDSTAAVWAKSESAFSVGHFNSIGLE